MPTWSNEVMQLGKAISVAEGSPVSWHNPGDMKFANGSPTCGFGNSEGVLKFLNVEDGWNALYRQCWLMLTGRSHVYSLDMTIAEVGLKYSGGDPNWSRNVAAYLGVPETTTLRELAPTA